MLPTQASRMGWGALVFSNQKDSHVQKFELGFAFRGTAAPEVKQVVEAGSMREAMLNVIEQNGGDDVVLVTSAHYFEKQAQLCSASGLELCSGAISSYSPPSDALIS
jgi:hypothetical protein